MGSYRQESKFFISERSNKTFFQYNVLFISYLVSLIKRLRQNFRSLTENQDGICFV